MKKGDEFIFGNPVIRDNGEIRFPEDPRVLIGIKERKKLKSIIWIIVLILIISLLPITGCSKSRENLESRTNESVEEAERVFDSEEEFCKYYEKAIGKALYDGDKQALKELFCEKVIDNTADLDDGIDYLCEMLEWSKGSGTIAHVNESSYKYYEADGHNVYVNGCGDITVDGKRYRVLYQGYSQYYSNENGKSESVMEKIGLTHIAVFELENGKLPDPCYHGICGIYYPGRKNIEKAIWITLYTWHSQNADGTYIEEMTDEALNELLSPDLLEFADGKEIEGLYRFMRLNPNAKDGEQWPMLEKDGLFICSVRYDLGDHGLAILFDKDGLIASAVLSDSEEIIKPKSGEIRGFVR